MKHKTCAKPRMKHPESALMLKTRELLKNTDKRLLDIYDDTGIQAHWLSRFANGAVLDPGVNRIETLYTYLTGRPLDLGE